MIYKDKTKWNTLRDSEESTEVAKILGVNEAKILRIGHDDSDEAELNHMDAIFLQARIEVHITSNKDIECIKCSLNGETFLCVVNGEVISYYIINEEGTPADFTLSCRVKPFPFAVKAPFDGADVLREAPLSTKKKSKQGQLKLTDDSQGLAEFVTKNLAINKINVKEETLRELVNLLEDVKETNDVAKEYLRGSQWNGDDELTIDKLLKMEKGVFAMGEIENSPEGLYMTNTNIGKKLIWVAKRGGIHDWAIYCHWKESGFAYVLTNGDKVSKYNVRKLVQCTDEALNMYRQ